MQQGPLRYLNERWKSGGAHKPSLPTLSFGLKVNVRGDVDGKKSISQDILVQSEQMLH